MSALLFPRKNARHAKPSVAPKVLAAGGITAAFAVADGAALAGAASAGGSVAQFERLAQCESGGRWSINTGNGYYGGLQFNLATWRGLGYGGYPHQASKATQISAGQKLHSQRGWQPWPSCSRKLGLTGDGGYSGSGTVSPSTTSDRREAASRASRTRSTAAPAWKGHVLSTADVSTYRADVAAWQQRMRDRGWKSLKVDGRFGPKTAAVAAKFAREKGLKPAKAGTVDRRVWTAAWTAPVT